MRKLRLLASGVFLVLVAGCATTGPRVSHQELVATEQDLAAKALLKTGQLQGRIWKVGYRLLEHLPVDEHHQPVGDFGVALMKIKKTARRAFNYDEHQHGICILTVREGAAADTAGLRAGDILVSINDKHTPSLGAFRRVARTLKPGDRVTVHVLRQREPLDVSVVVGASPRRIQFVVSHDQSVNAWAKGNTIAVTAGLLRFIDSDDELAVVLGHELAHIMERHRVKTVATGAVAATVGAAAGIATEVVLPGAGAIVWNTASGWTEALTQAAFSRNFEREADYKGLLYTYRAGYDVRAGIKIWERFATEIPEPFSGDLRSTHPASPERMIRIRKIVESLDATGLEGTIQRYGGGHEPSTKLPSAVAPQTTSSPPAAAAQDAAPGPRN